MRAVFDTGIYISALISTKSSPYQALDLWIDKAFELVTSQWQLDELKTVSRYAHIMPLVTSHKVGASVNRLRKRGTLAGPLPSVDYSPDPDDNPIIATAIAGRADYLVSGDKGDLLALRRVQGVQIVTARAFLQILGQ